MALDMTSTRTDVSFLRRRPRLDGNDTPKQATVASPGLNLSRPATGQQATVAASGRGSLRLAPNPSTTSNPVLGNTRNVPPARPVTQVPYLHNNTELSLLEPAVRMDFRQSAIGSLIITGAQAFVWETNTKAAGMEINGGQSSAVHPPKFGNRSLAEFQDGKIIVGLRHFNELRRLIIGSQANNLVVELYDGTKIAMPTENGNNVLLISRINNELECRMEKIDTLDIAPAFGIRISQIDMFAGGA